MSDDVLSDLLSYDVVKDGVVDLTDRAGETVSLRCFRAPDLATRAAAVVHAGTAQVWLLRPLSWANEKLLGLRVRVFHADPGARLFVRGPFAIGPKGVRVPLLDESERPAAAFAHPSRLVRLRGEIQLVGGQDPVEIELRAEGGDVLASVEAAVSLVVDSGYGPRDARVEGAAVLDRVLVPFRTTDGRDDIVVPREGVALHAGPCGWGLLRILGVVAQPEAPGGPILTTDTLRIGGSTNLFMDEDPVPLTSIAPESEDGPWLFRLRHEILLKAPNTAEIVLGVEGQMAPAGEARVRLWLYAAVVEAYDVRDARALRGLLCEDFPRGAKHVAFEHGRRADPGRTRMPRIFDMRAGGRALLLFDHSGVACVEGMFPAEAKMDAQQFAAALRRLADALDGDDHG